MQSNLASKHPYFNRRRRSVIQDFFRLTSIHGLPAIARAYNPKNLFCWSVIFFLFFAAMLYFVIISILVYFTYPTQTNVDIVLEYPMLFPAVTVCNYGSIRYDLIIHPFINYTNSIGLTSINNSAAPDFSNPLVQYALDQFIINIVDEGKVNNEYLFDLNEFLVSCSYNDLLCSASDFVPVSSFLIHYIFSLSLLFPSSSHHCPWGSVILSMRKVVV